MSLAGPKTPSPPTYEITVPSVPFYTLHSTHTHQAKLDKIAATMAQRANNPVFVMGQELRFFLNTTADIFQTGYSYGKNLWKTVDKLFFGDRVRNFQHPQYPNLSHEEQLCMAMDMRPSIKYQDGLIKIFMPEVGDLAKRTLLKKTVEDVLKAYGEYGKIQYEFVTNVREANLRVFMMVPGDSQYHSAHGFGGMYNRLSIHENQLEKPSYFLNLVTLHEAGHAFIGLEHPFNSSCPTVGDFLDHPEVTVMTYKPGKLTPTTPGFCDAVATYAKYGPNREWEGKDKKFVLQAGLNASMTLQTKEARSLYLDGSKVTKGPIEFMLGPSFRPTTVVGTEYFLAPGSTQIHAITSLLADKIYFGKGYNEVKITGGDGKLIIIQPNSGLKSIEGFRPKLDKLIFQGFSYKTILEIKKSASQSDAKLELDAETSIVFKGLRTSQLTALNVNFETEIEDGIHYIRTLYPEDGPLFELSMMMTSTSATLAGLYFLCNKRRQRLRHREDNIEPEIAPLVDDFKKLSLISLS